MYNSEVKPMKRRIFNALPFIVLGLVIAIGPQLLFQVCAKGEKVMKCFWTARVELGIGGLITALGLLLLVIRSKSIRLGLVIGLFLVSVLSVLVPTVLIGVCGMETMQCRVHTLPSLVVAGILAALISIIYGFILARDIKKAGEAP